MTTDPYQWPDASDYHTRICELEAENARLRAREAELMAEADRLLTSICHATIHDGREGRVGLPSVWKAVAS